MQTTNACTGIHPWITNIPKSVRNETIGMTTARHQIHFSTLTDSGVALEFLSCLEIQWNFRHCHQYLPLKSNTFATLLPCCRGWQIGNRKQCLKFHWISKQRKNSKATSEAVLYVLYFLNNCTLIISQMQLMFTVHVQVFSHGSCIQPGKLPEPTHCTHVWWWGVCEGCRPIPIHGRRPSHTPHHKGVHWLSKTLSVYVKIMP